MSQRKLTRILATALSAVALLALSGTAAASLDEGLETGAIPMTDVSGVDPAGEDLASDAMLMVEPDGMIATEPEGISLDEFLGSLDYATDDWIPVESESEGAPGVEPSGGDFDPEGTTGRA